MMVGWDRGWLVSGDLHDPGHVIRVVSREGNLSDGHTRGILEGARMDS